MSYPCKDLKGITKNVRLEVPKNDDDHQLRRRLYPLWCTKNDLTIAKQ